MRMSSVLKPVVLSSYILAVLVGGASAQALDPGIAKVEAGLRRARPLPMTAVRLTGGPLKHAQDLDAAYLLQLEPDRMLAFYRTQAGLKPKAEPYGGWDGSGRNLTGHIAGHYLSAVSMMYAATGDGRFKDRADYIVRELKEVQDSTDDGSLIALEGGRKAFADLSRGVIRSGGFDLNGLWSPWYTLHKTFAGLRDAFRLTGNGTALEIEIRFAAWAEKILSDLTETQVQAMLATEFGGMNEVMVDLYADTGDGRWLALSRKFEHQAFISPLLHFQDNLAWKHGNTQIPKIIGSLDRFAYTGDAADLAAASFFFERVSRHHTFATGGNGQDEYFGEPDHLGQNAGDRTAETCNVYNMLKLARRLFEFIPDAAYADFMERALFNHIMASIDPEDGRTCYMVPVGRGVQHEYQDMLRDFTCCVGSGMESHALHGTGIYYGNSGRLWINLYAPSTAEWAEAGLRLTVETGFPEGDTADVRIEAASPRRLTIALRRPWWARDGFSVSVNGRKLDLPVPAGPDAGRTAAALYLKDIDPMLSDYVEIDRTWKTGDMISVSLPKTLRLEPTPDDPGRAAILWGPLVLAGDIGPEVKTDAEGLAESSAARPETPVLVALGKAPAAWVERVPGPAVRFRTVGAGRPHEVDLYPFFRLHRRMYAVYFDMFTGEGWARRKAEYEAEEARLRALETVTVAYAQPGEMQPERNFRYKGGGVSVVRTEGRAGRGGTGWFSFEMPVSPSGKNALLATYHSGDRRRGPGLFDVMVDGRVIASQTVEASSPARFYDIEYALPEELTRGKTSVTVRFQAAKGREMGPVFGVRIVRR